MMFIRKFGFTLAEVLIVLGVLGIVASMTIPTLVANSEQKVEVTQLKKFYTVFSQGLKTYIAEQNCTDLECTGLFVGKRQDASWESNVDAAIRSEFKITKSCDSYTNGCNKPLTNLDRVTAATDSFYYGHSFETADGFLFMVYDTDSGNCVSNSGAPDGAKLQNNCGQVYVDINGAKKPDVWGRDMFMFAIAKDGTLYPWDGAEVVKIGGTDWRVNPLLCGTPGVKALPAGVTGAGCSARIMEEGWEMNY